MPKSNKPIVLDNLEELPEELKTIVDNKESSPQVRAKAIRKYFSSFGWPSVRQPLTVRDFMELWGIPCIDKELNREQKRYASV